MIPYCHWPNPVVAPCRRYVDKTHSTATITIRGKTDMHSKLAQHRPEVESNKEIISRVEEIAKKHDTSIQRLGTQFQS
jgi:hypothetical protein